MSLILVEEVSLSDHETEPLLEFRDSRVELGEVSVHSSLSLL